MKKLLLFIFIFIALCINGQEIEIRDENGNILPILEFDYSEIVNGELILKFAENCVNEELILNSKSKVKFKVNDVKNKNYKSDQTKSFFKDYKDHKVRKVVNNIKKLKIKSSQKSHLSKLMIMEIETDTDIKKLIKDLSEYPEIDYVEPNFLKRVNDNAPNDPMYDLQKGFESSSDHDIDANRAWDFTTGNYDVKVGILDYGIDYHHFDLGNGSFGVDGAKVSGGYDYYNDDSNPDEIDKNHGTEVAGIIGAIRNNNTGVAGLAGGNGTTNIGCQLVALKIGPDFLGGPNSAAAIEAIIAASTEPTAGGLGCHILNASYGGYSFNISEKHAISIAAQNNVVFVASKGNVGSSNYHYPSDYSDSWVLSVGATTSSDEHASFSNTGNNIDVSAPGGDDNDDLTYTTTAGGNYRFFKRTSAAAPHVSGLAALILSEAIEQGIDLHHQDVEGLIEASADDVNATTLPGYDDELGHGRINAGRALEYMNNPWKLTHHTTVGGTITNSTGWINQTFYGDGLINGVYSVKRHEVQTTVNSPAFSKPSFFTWGRGTNAATGWSAANPNYQLEYCDVVNVSGNEITLRTFIYEVKEKLTGYYLGWYPKNASNVTFAYTTLGYNCPPDIQLPNTTINSGQSATHQSSNTIENTSDYIINSGGNVILKAKSIRLKPGFHAKEGSTVRIEVDPCN